MIARKNKIAWLALAGIALLTGCASQPKITALHPIHFIDTSAVAIANIRSWFAARSLVAQSLSATGDVTLEQSGESNSASFTMKSKRIDIRGERIDSLSIEVMGPFGIKVARFLASPKQYAFYDLLHGQTMTGATDVKSLEDLTHLHGVSLQAMSDLVYGLPGSDLRAEDSMRFYSIGESRYVLLVQNFNANATSMLDLEGAMPNDSSAGSLMLLRYRRWNGILNPMGSKTPPAVSIRFSEPMMVNGFPIPQHIEVTAGENKLTLAYDHIELNPSALTIKIKMPQ